MSTRTLLVVDPDLHRREQRCRTLAAHGYRTVDCGDGPSAPVLTQRESVDLVIAEAGIASMDGCALLRAMHRRRPGVPVIVTAERPSVEQAVSLMRAGATDVLPAPVAEPVLIERIEQNLPPAGESLEDFVCEDPLTRRIAELAARVARTEATVLVTGQSGTGKEMLARFVHRRSPRRTGPFVAVNCAAIPENMLEAMLFGYEKGAFTGAYQSHPGKFEQAAGGTLLLDEIGEMEPSLQAKLLRVLQEREVERLGGRKTIPLDVRVLATTNRDLAAQVRDGRFREDLFYRLNVFPIRMPALASRPADILPLARRALLRFAAPGRPVPVLSDAAEARLLEHPWPGNVRELENVIQRALILCAGDRIEVDDLQFGDALTEAAAPAGRDTARLGDELRRHEHERILAALEATGGNRQRAAERLGISPRTLRYKLARLREAGLAIPDRFGAHAA